MCFVFRGLKKQEKGFVFVFFNLGNLQMLIFQKKGVVFVTAGLKVQARTYLGVKFGIKTPSFAGVVFFVFVFCFVLFFFFA